MVKILIRGQKPPAGVPEPTAPLFIQGQAQLLWLNIVNTPLERGGGPVAVGELLSVWHQDGKIFATEPGQCYPDYVVGESPPRS